MTLMYQNKKNLTMARLVEKNEDANQVKLVVADGSEIEVTISTFKRWWKKVDDEDVAGDGTPSTEVMPEDKSIEAVSFNSVDEVLANLVASGKKVYVDDAVKAVRAAGFEVDTTYIQNYLENGGKEEKKNKIRTRKEGKKLPPVDSKLFLQGISYCESIGGDPVCTKNESERFFKVGGKTFCWWRRTRNSIVFHGRSFLFKESEFRSPDRYNKHQFDAIYVLGSEDWEFAKSLINISFQYQVDKNNKKKEVA